MRSLTIFLGLILLTACKQFTLSKEDQKILAESDRLMEEQKKMTEINTFKTIHKMNNIVLETGRRPANLSVLEQTSTVWNEYKKVSERIGNWMGTDSLNSIDLYDDSMSVFGEEMKNKVSLPFKNFSYYSTAQLELELAWNFDQIVEFQSRQIGSGNVFYSLQIASIEYNEVTQLFLFIKESADIHKRVILPRSLSDSIHFGKLNSWTSLEFTDQDLVSLEYIDAFGQLKTIYFKELVTITKIN